MQLMAEVEDEPCKRACHAYLNRMSRDRIDQVVAFPELRRPLS